MSRNFEEHFSGPENKETEEQHEKSLGEIDLSKVFDSLEKYNESFSWGRTMGRAMIESFDAEESEGEAEKTFEDKVENERAGEYDKFLRDYGTDLARTGLNLEPVKSGIVAFSSTGELPELKMRINLEKGKRFLDYLDSLDKGYLTSGQIKGIEAVAKNLTSQLVEQYDLGDPNDKRMIELLSNLSKVIEKYNAIGNEQVSQSVGELAQYLEISKEKYLNEYLLAKKERLLAEVGSQQFGPSDWHGDSSPESYTKMWNMAIDKVAEIGKNKNAKKFQQQVIKNLKDCLVFAKKRY